MKKLFISFAAFAVILIIPAKANGYGIETHAYLTSEAIKFYNSKSTDRIDEKYFNYIIDGSKREDDSPRWLNHFYDPVFNRPLVANSVVEKSLITNLGLDLMKPIITTAKDWALNTSKQKNILWKIRIINVASILSGTEKEELSGFDKSSAFTWDIALDLYAKGEKEKAFYALGHILHLMEDMAVPEHTRNDTHAEGSPYEKYASRFALSSPDNDLLKRLQSRKMVKKDSPGEYFDALAAYSNNNFFSKDTFGIQTGYSLPSVELENFKYVNGKAFYLKTDEFGEYKLAFTNSPGRLSVFYVEPIENNVSSDYWLRLSTHSVTHSAGLIDLFIKEGEKKRLALESLSDISSPLNNKNNEDAFETIPQNNDNPPKTPAPPAVTRNDNLAIDDKNPILSLNTISAYVGDFIERSGSGFSPNSNILMSTLFPNGFIKEENIAADKGGNFTSSFKVNTEAQIGEYLVTARDEVSGKTSVAKFSILSAEKQEAEQERQKKETVANDARKLKPSKCSYLSNGYIAEKPIIFNEVNWMGSTASSSDEWIEFYNRSSSEINISNWSIVSKDGDISVSIPENTYLEPGEYYLLERTDDNSAKGIKADGFFSGAISNTKESLRILTADCRVIDEVVANPSWLAGDSAKRKTMERKSDLSWQTSSIVGGTPRAENSLGETIKSVASVSNGASSSSSSITVCKNITDIPDYQVLINEVAWSGTENSSSEEWIELYNPNNIEISLSGWQLTGGNGDKLYASFVSTDKISAKGYYLLTRGSSFITNVVSDKTFTGSINNSNETIALHSKDNCNLVDIVTDVGTDWKNIGGVNNPNKRSAERVNEQMWQTYQGEAINGIYGTPKAANSKKSAILGNWSNHLVISEIMVGDENNQDAEWIELYNPTDNPILLDNYSIRRISSIDSDNEDYLVSRPANVFNGKYVRPKGFFLIASKEFNAFPNNLTKQVNFDALYSNDTARLAYNGDRVVLYNEINQSIVDEVLYSETGANKSWERMATKDGLCLDPSTIPTEYIGNACDKIDPADYVFTVRNTPNPQNSHNLLEPRLQPIIGFPPENLNTAFISNRAEVKFSWPAEANAPEKIWELRVDDSSISPDAVSGEYLYHLSEVNKNIHITMTVSDTDGYRSDDIIEKEMTIPKLHNTGIFQTSRIEPDYSGQVKTGHFIKITPPSWPIFEESLTYRNNYTNEKKPLAYYIILFKNSDPLDLYIINESVFTTMMNDGQIIKINHRMGGQQEEADFGYVYSPYIGFPETTSEMVGYPGRILSKSFYDRNDNSITFLIDENFTEHDYITIGYYGNNFAPSGMGGDLSFKYITSDKNKIYPTTILPNDYNLPPETPVISLNRNDANSLVFNCNDCRDLDSPDKMLTYEFVIGEELSVETIWQPSIEFNQLNPGEKMWVRTVDDYGIKSEPNFAIVPPLNPSPDQEPEDEV